MAGNEADWDLHALMLANIFDAVRENTAVSGHFKKKDWPEPFPRPGVEPKNNKYGGTTVMQQEEADAWLGAAFA